MLHLPVEKFSRIPLGIDFSGFSARDSLRTDGDFRIGYFARVCPEKGLHLLVEAVRKVRAEHPQVKLVAGGYLGSRDAAYFEQVRRDARDLGEAFEYIGSPAEQSEKVTFLQSLDVLSVPAPYQEPKGIYVLEALACGVPVVQPAHGAYPEMIAATEGGLLFRPGDTDDLAAKLSGLIANPTQRAELVARGGTLVRERFSLTAMTIATISAFEALPHNATGGPSGDPDGLETP
jgi:glycosyltransferase involved in cell wall biosynthesis